MSKHAPACPAFFNDETIRCNCGAAGRFKPSETFAGRGVPDARVEPIRWYPCPRCAADHDTPTCPFGAVPDAPLEPLLTRALIARATELCGQLFDRHVKGEMTSSWEAEAGEVIRQLLMCLELDPAAAVPAAPPPAHAKLDSILELD